MSVKLALTSVIAGLVAVGAVSAVSAPAATASMPTVTVVSTRCAHAPLRVNVVAHASMITECKVAKSVVATKTVARVAVKKVTVHKHDTLWAIAVRTCGNGHHYRHLMKLNHLTSTRIYVGQILRIA